eukprot:s6562_g2.t1
MRLGVLLGLLCLGSRGLRGHGECGNYVSAILRFCLHLFLPGGGSLHLAFLEEEPEGEGLAWYVSDGQHPRSILFVFGALKAPLRRLGLRALWQLVDASLAKHFRQICSSGLRRMDREGSCGCSGHVFRRGLGGILASSLGGLSGRFEL